MNELEATARAETLALREELRRLEAMNECLVEAGLAMSRQREFLILIIRQHFPPSQAKRLIDDALRKAQA